DEPAGGLENVLRGTLLVEQHRADRAGDRARPPVDREGASREEEAQAFGEVGELRALDMRREHDELLPTPAADEIPGPPLAAQPLEQLHAPRGAGGVAIAGVDGLEAVEVEEAHRGGAAATSDPCLLGGQRLGERVAIRRKRQRVDPRARAFLRQSPLEAKAK